MKKLICLVMTLSLMLCVLFAMPVSASAASTAAQDGLEVTIATNKTDYSADEYIQVYISIKNTNTYKVEGISLETLLPEGIGVKNGTLTVNNIAIEAGETYSASVVAKSTAGVILPPLTGDVTNIALWIAVIAVAAIGLFFVAKSKKTTQMLSLLLCTAMLLTMLPMGAFAAADDTVITVEKTIKMAGKDCLLKATVTIPTALPEGYCRVRFDTYGGTAIEAQTVAKGSTVNMPQMPEKEGYVFVGWYTDSQYTETFDFTAQINDSCTVHARWVDVTDTTDTDGDGLTDKIEEYIGTDSALADTDNDGLNDYIEVSLLGYDPLSADTDNDGVTDAREDFDNDCIDNGTELGLGTDPCLADSDGDGLDDKDEIDSYKTDPVKADTDGDGVSDGKEIELGTDPLTAQAKFNLSVSADNDDRVTPTVDIELSGEQVESLSVEPVNNDNFFPETMPGYMGKAYDFSVEGQFESATISFEFDASALGADADPVIYYFDEQEQKLEALETTISGNVASATVTHFSKYILINRTIYNDSFTWVDVWDSTTTYTDVEIVLIIDDSGSMDWNDSYNQRLTVASTLVDQLPKNSKIGIVRFATYTSKLTTQLTNDRELAKSYLTTSYFVSNGGTYMYEAIASSFGLFESTEETTLKMMVVLSDGDTNDTRMHSSVVSTANKSNIRIYTVGLGSSTSYFNNYLKPLATNTAATFYLASNAAQLADIYKDINEKIDLETDTDHDDIPDYYEDNMICFNGVNLTLDKNNPDTDGDGIKDGAEIVITKEKSATDETKVKVTGKMVLGNPTKADTDGDGITDKDDPEPFSYTITDRTLALVQALSYTNLAEYVGKTVGEVLHAVDYTRISAENVRYLSDAVIVRANNSNSGYWGDFWDTGLGSVALKFERLGKKDAVIYGIRGTEFNTDLVNDGITDVALGAGWESIQSLFAFSEYVSIADKRNVDYYITGHSLGGRLALDVLYKVHKKNADGWDIPTPVHATTFNGLGYNDFVYFTLDNDIIDQYEGKLTNFFYWNDWVGERLGNRSGYTRPGTNVELLCKNIEGKLYRSIDDFSSWIRIYDLDYHGIKYFQDDYDLLPSSKSGSIYEYTYWID